MTSSSTTTNLTSGGASSTISRNPNGNHNSTIGSKAVQRFSELMANPSGAGDTLESMYDTRQGQRQGSELSDLFNLPNDDFPSSRDSGGEKTEKSFWEDPRAWAGGKIDNAVHDREKTVDDLSKDMVASDEEYGGFGKALAKGIGEFLHMAAKTS